MAPAVSEAAGLLEVAALAGLAPLEALRAEWSALCGRCPRATPFQRPEWLVPWARCFQPEAAWALAARGEDGRLLGLLPLFGYDDGGTRTLGMLGAGPSDYLDLLAEPGREREVAAALFARLGEERPAWDLCRFEQLRPGSPLLDAPLPAGCRERVALQASCPVLDLPASVEELHEILPKRQAANLRQFRRRAERRAGPVRLEAAGPATWERFFDELLRFHRQRWGEEGVLAGPAARAFHREAIPGFLERGALALYALTFDGQTAAVHYGLVGGGVAGGETAYCYLHGFDARWAKLSPGVLLLGGVLEEMVRRGARRYDFLRGEEDYKYRWGAEDREVRLRHVWAGARGARGCPPPGG